MCRNSPQNILDRLRHVYTLLIVTKSSECSVLTCVLELLEDKRQPAKLFLIFTNYYSRGGGSNPYNPSECQEVTSSVDGQKLE